MYENNKSAAQPIKDQISKELNVPLQYINSALVSAQNRQRFYAHNISNVPQPEDRGVLLKDILESAYPLNPQKCEKARPINAEYYKLELGKWYDRVYNQNPSKQQHDYVAVPIGYRGRMEDGRWVKQYEARDDEKANALTTAQTDSMVAELFNNIAPINDQDGKARTIKSQYYKTSIANCLYTASYGATMVVEKTNNNKQPIYKVKNELITVKDKQYPIKLPDGYYIIRKLTPVECERLQTLPDNYTACVSNTQRYKGLGNGWTAEVIIHILKHANVSIDEEIVVLSMYDGIGTGRYCFDKMGYKNIKYYAYEIDKYAMQVANSNYMDIVQCGDAFQVRKENWQFEKHQ